MASDFIKGILSFDKTLVGESIVHVIILGIGIVVVIVLIAKLIEKLMMNHKTLIYGFIVGLLIASPIAILVNLEREYPSQVNDGSFLVWLIGFLLVLVGAMLSYLLGKQEATPDIETLQENF